MKKQGWFRQSTRHALASHGIPTKYEDNKRVKKEFELNSIGFTIENAEDEEIFNTISKIFKDVGIYFNSKTEDDKYIFEFYEPKSKSKSKSKKSKANVIGDEVHIKVTSGKEYDSILEAIYLFNLAGYYFDVDWNRDEFSFILDFSKFYQKKQVSPESEIGTKSSKYFKELSKERVRGR